MPRLGEAEERAGDRYDNDDSGNDLPRTGHALSPEIEFRRLVVTAIATATRAGDPDRVQHLMSRLGEAEERAGDCYQNDDGGYDLAGVRHELSPVIAD
jgi:hypothetical protein